MQIYSNEKVNLIRNLLLNEGKISFPLISAVLQGFQRGKVFVDDIKNPQIIFVLTKYGFSQYFLLQNAILNESFVLFLKESVDIPFYFHVYNPDESLAKKLEQKGLVIKQRERQQLRYLSGEKMELGVLPLGYKLVDCNQVEFDRFDQFILDLDNRYWSSSADFIQNAYGKCIINPDNIPVVICYCACVVDGISEVDIATLPKYQGKGLGKITTQAFINESIAKGLLANWDCFSENLPSLHIAKATYFTLIKTYTFLSIYNQEKHNLIKL